MLAATQSAWVNAPLRRLRVAANWFTRSPESNPAAADVKAIATAMINDVRIVHQSILVGHASRVSEKRHLRVYSDTRDACPTIFPESNPPPSSRGRAGRRRGNAE